MRSEEGKLELASLSTASSSSLWSHKLSYKTITTSALLFIRCVISCSGFLNKNVPLYRSLLYELLEEQCRKKHGKRLLCGSRSFDFQPSIEGGYESGLLHYLKPSPAQSRGKNCWIQAPSDVYIIHYFSSTNSPCALSANLMVYFPICAKVGYYFLTFFLSNTRRPSSFLAYGQIIWDGSAICMIVHLYLSFLLLVVLSRYHSCMLLVQSAKCLI